LNSVLPAIEIARRWPLILSTSSIKVFMRQRNRIVQPQALRGTGSINASKREQRNLNLRLRHTRNTLRLRFRRNAHRARQPAKTLCANKIENS
jgi:hypothetical protein